ncbi:hypothetical protein ACF0H5_013335 [Mactra antiquata]
MAEKVAMPFGIKQHRTETNSILSWSTILDIETTTPFLSIWILSGDGDKPYENRYPHVNKFERIVTVFHAAFVIIILLDTVYSNKITIAYCVSIDDLSNGIIEMLNFKTYLHHIITQDYKKTIPKYVSVNESTRSQTLEEIISGNK